MMFTLAQRTCRETHNYSQTFPLCSKQQPHSQARDWDRNEATAINTMSGEYVVCGVTSMCGVCARYVLCECYQYVVVYMCVDTCGVTLLSGSQVKLESITLFTVTFEGFAFRP